LEGIGDNEAELPANTLYPEEIEMADRDLIRVGVIGTGGIAQYLHLRQYSECDDAEVVALCDVSEEALAATQLRWGLEDAATFANAGAMLAEVDLDAVSICSPNDSHRDLALAASEAGVAVLCEKPLALNAAQARDMVQGAEAAGVVNMTGFSKRFFPAARLAKSLIREGELGEIYVLEGHYVQGWGLRAGLPLVWRLQRDRAGSGALGDLGSHLFDLARWWVGEAEEVVALTRTFVSQRPLPEGRGIGTVDVDDHVGFLVHFQGGAVGTFTASRMVGSIRDDCRLTAHGSQGSLTFTTQQRDKLQVCLGEAMQSPEPFTEVDVPREHKNVDEIPTFVQAVRAGTPVEPSFVDGLRCQELLDAVLESAATGRRMTLPQ
jgi:predicted dehydrogenase